MHDCDESCAHACVRLYMYACVNGYVNECACICVCMCAYALMLVCGCVFALVCACEWVRLHLCMFVRACLGYNYDTAIATNLRALLVLLPRLKYNTSMCSSNSSSTVRVEPWRPSSAAPRGEGQQ